MFTILKLASEQRLNLQIHTPVTGVQRQSSGHCVAEIPRGPMSTINSIPATNEYNAHVLLQFQGVIVPSRGPIMAQQLGTSLLHCTSLTTHSFVYDIEYDYMISRPGSSIHAGDIVIGGGWGRALPDNGAYDYGITDDLTIDTRVSKYSTNNTTDASAARIRVRTMMMVECDESGLA